MHSTHPNLWRPRPPDHNPEPKRPVAGFASGAPNASPPPARHGSPATQRESWSSAVAVQLVPEAPLPAEELFFTHLESSSSSSPMTRALLAFLGVHHGGGTISCRRSSSSLTASISLFQARELRHAPRRCRVSLTLSLAPEVPMADTAKSRESTRRPRQGQDDAAAVLGVKALGKTPSSRYRSLRRAPRRPPDRWQGLRQLDRP